MDVFEFLKSQRESGNNQFWTIKEVQVSFRNQGFSRGVIEGIKGDLVKLEVTGYLDGLVQRNGWNRAWRIKSKYVKKASGRVKFVKGVKV